MRFWGALALIWGLALSGRGDVSAQVPPIEVVSTEEFLELTEDQQVLFLSGVLEGIAFANYGRPDYPKWVECVRMATMGTLRKQVLGMTVVDARAKKEPAPWLVVRAIAARDCAR